MLQAYRISSDRIASGKTIGNVKCNSSKHIQLSRAAIPLIPCPEVQPPAILAPIMRATPPTVARATDIRVVSMAGVMPRALLKDKVPTSIPRAMTRGLGDGQVESLHGDIPVKRHI